MADTPGSTDRGPDSPKGVPSVPKFTMPTIKLPELDHLRKQITDGMQAQQKIVAAANLNIKLPTYDVPSALLNIKIPDRGVELGYAHVLYERLISQIKEFEATIDPDEEVAAQFASFGSRVVVIVEQVGYQNPYFIVFRGVNADTGHRVHLVQHTSQLNVMLAAVRVEEDRPPKRIGFVMESDVENSGSED